MSNEPASSRGLPHWISALALLLLLLGMGWGVWRYAEGGNGELPASAAASLTDANADGPALPPPPWQRPPNFGQAAARFAANMPDGIMPAGNAYLVKSGTARLDIDPQAGNGKRGDWRCRFSYAIPDLPSPQEMNVIRAARRALNDPAAAQKLGATPEQIQQLRPLLAGGMVVEPTDRARISVLFQAWLAASGRSATSAAGPTTRPSKLPAPTADSKAAEDQLLAALGEIGNRQLGPTRQSYSDRVQRIHAILGDSLLQKL